MFKFLIKQEGGRASSTGKHVTYEPTSVSLDRDELRALKTL